MKQFRVDIIESVNWWITLEATDKAEAEAKALRRFHTGKHRADFGHYDEGEVLSEEVQPWGR